MTIVAISTPIGAGGIAVVRLSGERALDIASKLFSRAGELSEPNKMVFGTVKAKGFSDKCYAVFFKAPKSYTGEDIVEFQLHGGVALAEGVLKACVDAGAEPAQRGEFTKRAFLNGKLALSDAEGVIDMINADSEAALNSAYRLMTGDLSRKADECQNKLFELITELEAVLDYPEELEDEIIPAVNDRIADILNKLKAIEATGEYGKMAKYGLNVVLTGNTNVGKSSLMNAMLGDNRAIVTPIAGTTRDVLNESLIYEGVKINLTDTAGIRESTDEIEKEGIQRAKNAVLSADLVLYVVDDTMDYNQSAVANEFNNKRIIKVINKSDLTSRTAGKQSEEKGYYAVIALSAKTREGIKELLEIISQIYKRGSANGELITNSRHLYAIKRATSALSAAEEGLKNCVPTDCLLVDLRTAWIALGEITGSTASDDIIEAVFSRFCVGK